MKIIQRVLFITIFCHFSVQASAPGFTVGFELFELSGSDKTSLASLRGKVVYVDFWASWCVQCKESLSEANKLYTKYRKQGLEIVAINLDSNPQDGQKFLRQYPVDYKVLYDYQGKVAELFEVKAMPSSFLIDKGGMLRLNHKRGKRNNRKILDLAITKLLKE